MPLEDASYLYILNKEKLETLIDSSKEVGLEANTEKTTVYVAVS
jgi:hypothetical protein